MTDIDTKSAADSERREDERLRSEIQRVADLVAAMVQRETVDPMVRILAPGLAFAVIAKNYRVTWAMLRSQLQNFWLAMGERADDSVQVVTPGQFDALLGRRR